MQSFRNGSYGRIVLNSFFLKNGIGKEDHCLPYYLHLQLHIECYMVFIIYFIEHHTQWYTKCIGW